MRGSGVVSGGTLRQKCGIYEYCVDERRKAGKDTRKETFDEEVKWSARWWKEKEKK